MYLQPTCSMNTTLYVCWRKIKTDSFYKIKKKKKKKKIIIRKKKKKKERRRRKKKNQPINQRTIFFGGHMRQYNQQHATHLGAHLSKPHYLSEVISDVDVQATSKIPRFDDPQVVFTTNTTMNFSSDKNQRYYLSTCTYFSFLLRYSCTNFGSSYRRLKVRGSH